MVLVGGDVGARALAVRRPVDARQRPLDAGRNRVGHGTDRSARDVTDVEDVLTAHHPGADDAVADRVAHGRSPYRYGTGATPTDAVAADCDHDRGQTPIVTRLSGTAGRRPPCRRIRRGGRS